MPGRKRKPELPAKWSIVVSFNRVTKQIMYQEFEGDGAAKSAEEWSHEASFIRRDFPESDGWVHFHTWSREAGEERGKEFVEAIQTERGYVLSVPQ